MYHYHKYHTVMTFCYFIVIICELVMVNYCDLHIAVTDVPPCLWNSQASLAGNTGFICPLCRSVSTKQSGWLHNLWADWLFGSIVRFQTSYVAVATPTHLFCSIAADGAESASPSIIANVHSFVCKHCVAYAPDHTAQPAATSSPHSTVTKGVAMEYTRVVGEWRRKHDVIFIRSNPAFDRFQTSRANWLMIKR